MRNNMRRRKMNAMQMKRQKQTKMWNN